MRLSQSIVPPNSPYHRYWLCRIVGHTLYTCPFLTKEQQLYSAYRNYEYHLETSPHMRNLLRQLPDDRFRQAGNRGRQRQVDFREPGKTVLRRPDQGYRSSDTNYPRRGGQTNREVRRPTQNDVQGAMMYLRDLVTSDFATRANEEPVMLVTADVARLDGERLDTAPAEQENPPKRNTSSRPDTSDESSSSGKE